MGSNKRYVIIKDIMDSISLCNRMPTKRKTTSHLHVYARFVNVIAKRVGLGKPYPAAARALRAVVQDQLARGQALLQD